MRRILLNLFWCSFAFATTPTDSLTISDTTGSTQTNRPVTISRFFALSEIAAYPQAGLCTDSTCVSVSSWLSTQADVKTRWTGGSVQHAMVSFVVPSISANGSVYVTFRSQASGNNTGYLNGAGMLAFNESIPGAADGWNAQMEFTGSPSNVTLNLRTFVAALDFTAGKMQYWLQGAIVTQVIVEDASAALSADFGFGTYTCGTDNPCKSLHPMAVLTFWAGVAGVKVEFVTENEWTTKLQNQQYDLVLKTNNSSRALTQVYSQSAVYHTARARWRRTYWSGTAPGAIWVDYNLPYLTYSKAIPNYDTSITLTQAGICDELYMNATSTCSAPSYSSTRSSISWYASDQGTTLFSQTTLSGALMGAQWAKQLGSGGGVTGEVGPTSRWNTRYLYAMNSSLPHARELWLPFVGNADKVAEVPLHYRELDGTRYYDSAHTVSAFGRGLSADARPQLSTSDPNNTNAGSSITMDVDKITYIGTIDAGGWNGFQGISFVCTGLIACAGTPTTSAAHFQFDDWVPYLITGDWFYLGEIQQAAAWMLRIGSAGSAFNNYASGGSHQDWSIFNAMEGRGEAWGMLRLSHAYVASPDSTPEKTYFKQKLDYNLEAEEGSLNLTTGSYYHACTSSPFNGATETSKWCWSLKQKNRNDSYFATYDPNPLHFPFVLPKADSAGACLIDQAKSEVGTKFWMFSYYQLAMGLTASLYPSAVPAQQLMVQSAINDAGSNGWNPWLNGVYTHPGALVSTHQYPTTWANFYDEWINTTASGCDTDWPDGLNPRTLTSLNPTYNAVSVDVMAVGFEMGYNVMSRVAVSFGASVTTPEGNNGLTAYNWVKNTEMAGLDAGYAANPKWAILPRVAGTLPTITTTSPLTSGTVGVAYSLQFAATGDTPITWTYDAVPAGLTLSSTGLLSGTPTTAGTSIINVTATNAAGSAGPTGFSLAIGGAGVYSQATGRMTGTIK